jgi:DNA-binding MarR family transcriptional regulator
MPLLMLKDLPRYECLLGAAQRYPSLQPSACDAFLNLLRTGDHVFEAEGRFLSQHGISQGRFTVLMLLNRCGEQEYSTPAELADAAGVTRATMTGLLDTLEKDGWARRETDPTDRRTLRVRLTATGDAFLQQTLPDYFRCVADLMDPLNEEERRQMVGLLQKIQQGLGRDAVPIVELATTLN